jgi:hypothetical protein
MCSLFEWLQVCLCMGGMGKCIGAWMCTGMAYMVAVPMHGNIMIPGW